MVFFVLFDKCDWYSLVYMQQTKKCSTKKNEKNLKERIVNFVYKLKEIWILNTASNMQSLMSVDEKYLIFLQTLIHSCQ